MALKEPKLESIDQYTADLLEAARKTVAQEVAEMRAAGIPVYYIDAVGLLIQEMPDGTKHVIAPAHD